MEVAVFRLSMGWSCRHSTNEVGMSNVLVKEQRHTYNIKWNKDKELESDWKNWKRWGNVLSSKITMRVNVNTTHLILTFIEKKVKWQIMHLKLCSSYFQMFLVLQHLGMSPTWAWECWVMAVQPSAIEKVLLQTRHLVLSKCLTTNCFPRTMVHLKEWGSVWMVVFDGKRRKKEWKKKKSGHPMPCGEEKVEAHKLILSESGPVKTEQ